MKLIFNNLNMNIYSPKDSYFGVDNVSTIKSYKSDIKMKQKKSTLDFFTNEISQRKYMKKRNAFGQWIRPQSGK